MTEEQWEADRALVLRAYEAWERGDIDAAVADMAPDIEWVEPEEFPNGGRRQGPAAVAEYLRASRAGWSELRSERTAHRRGDDVAIVHHVTGTLLDGTAQEVLVADVFTVEDGRVVRMHASTDVTAVVG